MKSKFFSLIIIGVMLVGCFLVVLPTVKAAATWTYNAGTNTATFAGAGGGSTNFAALVAADTAGGWGKFTADATGTQILCNGKIVIGDGTNTVTFSDTRKQVTFLQHSWSDYSCITVKNHATVTFGTLVSGYSTKDGCQFVNKQGYSSWNFENGSALNLYSCLIQSDGTSYNTITILGDNLATVKMYNSQLGNGQFSAWTGSGNDYFNDVFYSTVSNAVFLYGLGNYDVIRSYGAGYVAYASATYGGVTVKNSVFSGVSSGIAQVAWNDVGQDCYFVNTVSDSWHINFMGTVNAEVYRQYEFDLAVLNGEITDFVEDANVTLTKNGVKVGSWLTNSSGQIPTQVVNYGFYNQTGGDSIYDASYPFVLTVTADGWQDYTSRFYVTEKTKMTISMQEPVASSTPDPSVYTLVEDSEESLLVVGVVVGFLVLVFVGVVVGRRRKR